MFTLLSHEDWKVELVMNTEGQWFFQFTCNGDMFSWKIDRETSEGMHFHSWIAANHPEVISKAMDKLW